MSLADTPAVTPETDGTLASALRRLPLFPLPNAVLFPHALLPLRLVMTNLNRAFGGTGDKRRHARRVDVRAADVEQGIAESPRRTHRAAHASERFGERDDRNVDDALHP